MSVAISLKYVVSIVRNILIFTKAKDFREAKFYAFQTIENHWSRDVLALQIKTNLWLRTGSAVSNFKTTLPEPLGELAQQTLKDPYIFDFLTISEGFKEKDSASCFVAIKTI